MDSVPDHAEETAHVAHHVEIAEFANGCLHIGLTGDVGEEHGELVAADPCEELAFAQRRLEHRRDPPQQLVARRLAEVAGAELRGVALAAGAAVAQPYPAKPARIVLPFPAGGSADIIARLIARKFGDSMGQSFVVDNRAGAAGIIGTFSKP